MYIANQNGIKLSGTHLHTTGTQYLIPYVSTFKQNKHPHSTTHQIVDTSTLNSNVQSCSKLRMQKIS
jgi:hypothetical protein